ncbi:MAG: LptF/LptG family permease [Mariprofundaceae bacterium]|nr:LptF/LptG family permease [Mariprofundaceae bacterium]
MQSLIPDTVKLMVLDRYIFRLWAGSFLGFLFIVTGVLLLGRALKLLGMFADKGVEWSIMATMLMAIIPYFLVITVPIAFFFALQGMFLKLYQSSEMDAIRASGISYVRLLRPIFAAALLLWLLLTMTSLYWMPEGQKSFQGLLLAIQKAKPTPGFDPQRFNHQIEDFTIYADGENDKGQLQGFMLEDRRYGASVVYLAEWAEIGKSGENMNFTLYNGTRLEGSMANLRSLSFDRYQVSLNLGELGLLKVPVWGTRVFEMNVSELRDAAFQAKRTDAIAELNRRLLLPTTILILLFFCLPLSFAPKRSGKAGSYIIGTALLLLVYNVQILLQQQVHSGYLPWWSMWLGQFLLLVLALWSFRRACQDRLPSLLLLVDSMAATVHQKVVNLVGKRSDKHPS